MTEKLREVRIDCDYWWPEKEECMKMTAALVEFGAVNYHATMKGQPRSCCGNKIGCYLTREARTMVRQSRPQKSKLCAYDDVKGTLCGDNSLSTKFNHAITCEDCLKILKEKK